MTDLSEVNMDGVKASEGFARLEVGKYLVRIEDTERKQVEKAKFSETNEQLPPEYYLQFSLKVYGGQNDGHVEKDGLNLWNHTPEYVGWAKSTLANIVKACGIETQIVDKKTFWIIDGKLEPADAKFLHGKWMMLEIVAGKKETNKDKLYKHYLAAPPELVAAYADVPPVAPKAAAAPAAAQPAYAAQAAAPVASALPAWAMKK